MDLQNLTLEVEQQIEIKASLAATFDGLLRQLTDRGPGECGPDQGAAPTLPPLRLERWPGGRWYRDLGEGVGHLWGVVQVIKPPTLLEIQGPMFMSYPVVGHVQFRLTEVAGGTRVTLRHRAFGLIEEAHRQGVTKGWQQILAGIKAVGK
jgi:hypothetical protein